VGTRAAGKKGTSKPNEARLTIFSGEDKGKGRASFRARACARIARAGPDRAMRSMSCAPVGGTTLAPHRAMSVDRVRVSPLVKGSTTDDGLVLLDVRGGVVFASNVVGARIWRLIEDQQDTSAIALAIASEFEVDPDRARRDVEAFVASLCERGIVSREQPC
jgi:hypothetical protein